MINTVMLQGLHLSTKGVHALLCVERHKSHLSSKLKAMGLLSLVVWALNAFQLAPAILQTLFTAAVKADALSFCLCCAKPVLG